MEYTFNHTAGTLTSVSLNDYQLTIKEGADEKIIPYSSITDVRLDYKGNMYFMEITSLDFGKVTIYSGQFNNYGTWIDQARQYQTFVRILHLHLQKIECSTAFWIGSKPTKLSLKFGFVFAVTSLGFVLEEYIDFFPLPAIYISLVLLAIGAAFVMLPFLIKRPKNYHPADIPLNALPPAT